jgi:3-phenylpropionate/trans-cinnamate dioxygenase ferredoxin subunit
MSSDWVNVETVATFEPGERRIVLLDTGIQVAIFNVDGKYLAIEDICSHDCTEMCENALVEGCEVECPRHGSRFDLRTGEALTPPAYEPIPVVRTRLCDGVVQVEVV